MADQRAEEPVCEECVLLHDEYVVLGKGDGGSCPKHDDHVDFKTENHGYA